MDLDGNEKIMQNFSFLLQNTVNIPLLVLHLVKYGVLSPEDKEYIEGQNTSTEKLYKFYTTILKKQRFSELIDALEASENCVVADKLKGNQRQLETSTHIEEYLSQDGADFTAPVTDLKAVEINFDLEKLHSNWETVVASLKLSAQSSEALTEHTGSFGSLIYETISLLAQEKGSETNFNDFFEIVKGVIKQNLSTQPFI